MKKFAGLAILDFSYNSDVDNYVMLLDRKSHNEYVVCSTRDLNASEWVNGTYFYMYENAVEFFLRKTEANIKATPFGRHN